MSTMNNIRVVIDPKILAGHPVIFGTRIPVSLVLNLFSHGYTIGRIMKEYPELSRQDIEAAVSYAEERLKREEVFSA